MDQRAFKILKDEPTTQQPKKKKGGFLSSLLPVLGGAVGGAAGVLAAPFTGGASILAGGALGSGLGEFARQKVTGEDFSLGNIGRETLFGAVPGVGKAAKAGLGVLKGAKTAKTAASILAPERATTLGKNVLALENNRTRQNIVSDLLAKEGQPTSTFLPSGGKLVRPEPVAAPQVPNMKELTPSVRPKATEILQPVVEDTTDVLGEARPVGTLARESERLFGRQTGIMPGAKVGSSILDTPGMPKATNLRKHIKDIGGKPTDTAATIFDRNNTFIQNTSAKLNQILETSAADVSSASSKILRGIKKPVGVDLTTSQVYSDLINDLPKIKSVKDLNQYKRQLDEVINYSRPGVDPKEERVARAARKAINEYVGKVVPESKQLNKSLSSAYDVQKFIQPAAAKPPNAARPFGIPIPGSARLQQSAAGVGAKALDILGGSQAATGGGITRPLVKAGMQQGATRVGASALLGTPLVGSPEQQAQVPEQLSPELQDILSSGTQQPEQPQMTQEEATAQALQILAMQAAANGDTEQANAFLRQAVEMGKVQKESAETVKQQAKASAANSIIDELESVFTQAGGAKGPIAGRATLLGAATGGGNQTAKAYQEMRGAYTAQISRALGEVGVLTDKDREVIQQAIPSINDSDESKQIKIATLRNILSDLANRPRGSATSGASQDDVMATLQQLGY